MLNILKEWAFSYKYHGSSFNLSVKVDRNSQQELEYKNFTIYFV